MANEVAIDINHQAIHEAMRLYRLKNRQECFEKVLVMGHWWIEKLRKNNAH